MDGLPTFLFLFFISIARISSKSVHQRARTALDLKCLVSYPKSMSCHWRPQDAAPPNTKYKLVYKMMRVNQVQECKDYITGGPNSCYFSRENLYLYWTYEIWIEALSRFGHKTYEKVTVNTEDIAQTEPPVSLTGDGYVTHLHVEWGYPPGVGTSFFPLMFELRYLQEGSYEWLYDTDVGEQTSYSIYDVAPNCMYTLQVRCKHANHKGFWSEWSTALTLSTTQQSK
ncbi:cytokine receptor-like factor 1 [Ambystoma mexicanum]|uniref:cytokine receptor-like factor 1 n=1 Tax=Ambystoma mexicanum TaxID=8296 RepID=UPI0037E96A84